MNQPDLAAAVDRVLAPTLSSLGFAVAERGKTVVSLVGGPSAISLSYSREDLPRAWLSVAVGVIDVPGSRPDLIALWRVFPEAGELQDPDQMCFSSDRELEVRLVRVRDDLWPRFIDPALMSATWRRTALLDQEHELLVEHETLKREQHLREARSRFDGEDYEGAIEAYVFAGVDTLSAADRRRLDIARRHQSDGPSA